MTFPFIGYHVSNVAKRGGGHLRGLHKEDVKTLCPLAAVSLHKFMKADYHVYDGILCGLVEKEMEDIALSCARRSQVCSLGRQAKMNSFVRALLHGNDPFLDKRCTLANQDSSDGSIW
jgi:hypothetical protein